MHETKRHDPILGAHDLLQSYLELKALTPDLRQWTEEQLRANPPRYVRFKRLTALLSAFDIPADPRSFSEGRFFETRSSSDELYERLWNDMPKQARRALDSGPWELQYCFEGLLRYREKVDAALRSNYGVLEASGLALYRLRKAYDLNQIIRQHLPHVDDVLALMVSPEGATFRVSELMERFDYPDVDIVEIDDEWM